MIVPCYEIEVITNKHSRYILPHTYRGVFKVITWLRLNVGYIWESMLTNMLEFPSRKEKNMLELVS